MKLQFLPDQASNFAREYDLLYWVLTGFTLFFTVLVLAIIFTFVVKYRRGKKADRSNPVHHNSKLEALLLGLPTILALGVFVWGTKIFINMREVPPNAMEIFVVGKRWMWHVQHKDGIRENNELHVPLGQPVKVTIISQDVIHGFYIPQFRVQYHAVPGRYTYVWFTPTKPGRYNLFCTIHCGTQHSEMGGYVYVLPPTEWAKWKAEGGNRFKPAPEGMVAAGKKLWDENRCDSCHGAADNKRGPALMGVFNKQVTLDNGASVVADRAYLREAIVHPYSQIKKGYTNSMPDYQGFFSEDQVNKLIEYIKAGGVVPAQPVTNTPLLDHKDVMEEVSGRN